MKKVVLLLALTLAAFAAGKYGTAYLMSKPAESEKAALETVSEFKSLAPDQFYGELSSGKYTLLDVRTQEEYDAGHLSNAKLVDYYKTKEFTTYLESLDRNGNYLIYCRSGNRSKETLKLMKEMGFSNVVDLDGGYQAWASKGLPSEY
jgi:rhodanese-related sulfurtransferase